MHLRSIIICNLISLAIYLPVWSQTSVSGTVIDLQTGESIVGAHVIVKGSLIGTLSNVKGEFTLNTPNNPPFVLVFSALGYDPRELDINQSHKYVAISLTAQQDGGVVATAMKSEDLVVSASKLEERTIETPVTTYKLGLLSLRELPAPDVYSGLAFLPEVQMNHGSLSFVSLNTRGLADLQNWRFVQLVDGVDMAIPGLNYSLGNLSGNPDLDLRNIELIAGPGSALYGSNAYNGALLMHTKSPFDYPGISASINTGVSVQSARGAKPFSDIAVRVAKSFRNKFAFKLNLSYLKGTDWEADDQSHYISNTDAGIRDELLARPRNHPNYNAVSVYGDEITAAVDLGGNHSPTLINRSGIPERDIIDYSIHNIKVGTTLHYRISPKLETIYDLKFMESDAILRHTTTIPLKDFRHLVQNIELRSDKYYVRGYYSKGNASHSYAMWATGAYIQEELKPSELWASDYGAAYRGEIPGVEANNHDAARAFADRDIPGPESKQFQMLRTQSLQNPDWGDGGSKLIDRTGMLHLDFKYDLGKYFSPINLLAGGSLRRYDLLSEGKLYNDGPRGFNRPIPVIELGTYLQLSRELLDDRIMLRATARLDKNKNYPARFTPRISAVLSPGENHAHRIRVLYQTGFRNPSPQEAYMALDLDEVILLGGTKENISHYKYYPGGGDLISGSSIHSQLISLASLQAFFDSGSNNPELLQAANLSFLEQERIQSFEIGYRVSITDRFQLSIHAYRNVYENLISSIGAFSLLINRPFLVYTNISDRVSASGCAVDLLYSIPGGYVLSSNYSFIGFQTSEAVINNPGFIPSVNTPKNRVNLSLSNRDIFKGLGINLHFRWSDAYLWQSPYGQGEIEAFSQVDGALIYQIPSIRSTLKIGGSNLLRREYKSVYGGPYVGSIYYISFVLDEIKRKK